MDAALLPWFTGSVGRFSNPRTTDTGRRGTRSVILEGCRIRRFGNTVKSYMLICRLL